MVLPCIVVDWMVLICIVVDLRVPLYTMVYLTVAPCIVVGQMNLPYNFFKRDFVLESWVSQNEWEKFLIEEYPVD
jgi:hypothetical protein